MPQSLSLLVFPQSTVVVKETWGERDMGNVIYNGNPTSLQSILEHLFKKMGLKVYSSPPSLIKHDTLIIICRYFLSFFPKRSSVIYSIHSGQQLFTSKAVVTLLCI